MTLKIISGPKLIEISDDARILNPEISHPKFGMRGRIWDASTLMVTIEPMRFSLLRDQVLSFFSMSFCSYEELSNKTFVTVHFELKSGPS